MNCYLCKSPIANGQRVEFHHPVYKSKGGTETRPTHKACHRSFHNSNGDFKAWGRIGGRIAARTYAWAFNLRGVKDSPQFAIERGFYLAFSKGGAR